MAIEFKVGSTDHKAIEDFLGGVPDGVDGVLFDPRFQKFQQGAVEAARAARVPTYWDTGAERLFGDLYLDQYGKLYGLGQQSAGAVNASLTTRSAIVESVVSAQLDAGVSRVVAPHVFVTDDTSFEATLNLARLTAEQFKAAPIRTVLSGSRTYFTSEKRLRRAVVALEEAGVGTIDLRLSPLGGEDEGRTKIRGVVNALVDARPSNAHLVLGYQGVLGPSILALGLAQSYSVGVGMRESFDYASKLASERTLANLKANGLRATGGAVAGVFIPQLAKTLPVKVAQRLLETPSVRARLACQLEGCRNSVDGPVHDTKRHYLHSRAADVVEIEAFPTAWRSNEQKNRLDRQIAMRKEVNLLLAESERVPVRTLETLRAELDCQPRNGWGTKAG